MPIQIKDPMEYSSQWRGRKKKGLPPDILRLAGVLSRELRDHLKPGAPPGIFLQAAIAVVRAQQVLASDTGKDSVMKRHAAPGGSRDLADEVRKAWASGEYKSREKCADAVHEHIGLSRKAARNALIGTPKPIRRG